MKTLSKLILINFLIFLLSITIIELFFGYWFDKNNFGPYMREHRMKKVLYELNYNQDSYKYIYLRNYYGFRGEEINPDQIKILMVGGSTTDERYKPEEFTIIGELNKKLEKKGYKHKILNAGVEGQSTFGHLSNFKFWFNKIDGFKPTYIIYYIGINDAIFFDYIRDDNLTDGWIENPNKIERFFDNLKSRSIFYDLARKFKHKYYLSDSKKRVVYDLDFIQKQEEQTKRKYLNYDNKLNLYDYERLKSKNSKLILKYINNIDKLYELTKSYGAEPIFINQPAQQGFWSEKLFLFNNSLILHCLEKNYFCINLNKNLTGKNSYWWDGIHTTPEGSKEISNVIFPELFIFLNK